MKAFAFAMFVLLAASVLSAENYTAQYTAGGWLKVTRTIVLSDSPCFGAGVSNACMNDGAVHPPNTQYGPSTNVTITVENVGQIERRNISVGEDLTFVPDGAEVDFFPVPSSGDGEQVFWAIGSLQPNESKSVSYWFSATLSEGLLQRIPEASIVSQPVFVSLSAPRASTVGDTLSIALQTASGQPVGGATVYVLFPDGSRLPLLTGRNGVATFTASRQGGYSYSVDGYQLEAPVSTDAGAPEAAPPVVAAAVGNSGLLSSLAGILPILGAIFAIAVVILIIYNFFASRREEDEGAYAQPQVPYSYPQAGIQVQQAPLQPTGAGVQYPAQAQPSAPPAYTQRFSFYSTSPDDGSMRQTTRGILESRRQLKGSVQPSSVQGSPGIPPAAQDGSGPEDSGRPSQEDGGQQGGARPSAQDGAQPRGTAFQQAVAGRRQQGSRPVYSQSDADWQGEQTEASEEGEDSRPGLDSQVAKLEAKARAEGETASEEEEIERTIAELEAIREKLRSRRFSGQVSRGEAQQTAAEDSEGRSGEETIGQGSEEEGTDEREEADEPEKKKPGYASPSREGKPRPKPKRMKYASHGTRKK